MPSPVPAGGGVERRRAPGGWGGVNVFCIRHGETEWTLSGRHTGVTDLPLTEAGRLMATRLRPVLARETFALVLVSPLRRARETCELAGLGVRAVIDPDLREWDYGAYEGLTTAAIHAERPGWTIFRDGAPDGETPDQVGARADRVIARARGAGGDVALFAHGHLLRVLAARWIELPPEAGARFLLDTGTISGLTIHPGEPAVKTWNAAPPD